MDQTLEERIADLERELVERTAQERRTAARFHDIIDRNADAFVIVDREGRIRFANRAAAQLFGRDADALLGMPFGFPVTAGETSEVDIPHNSAPRVAEMRVDSTEWEGAPAYVASLRDITERRRMEQVSRSLFAEQAAREVAEQANRRLHFLLETTTVLTSSLDYRDKPRLLARICVDHLCDWAVVYGLDRDGEPRRLAVEHCEPSKAPLAEELRSIPIDPRGIHPILEVIRSRQSRLVTDITPEMLTAMSANPREVEIARELGVASFMSVPVVARDRVLGAIAFVAARSENAFDTSDLKLAEDVARRAALALDNALLHEQAQLANQRKADFLAVVSHDLRTPLNAILGYADLMDLGVPEPISPGARDRVQRIRSAAKHLLYLLNELLAFARLEASHEVPHMQNVDVGALMKEVAAVAEPLAGKKGLQFVVELPDEPITLSTDPDKLRQILLNLVGNAVKYTPQGEVRVSVSRSSTGMVRFVVSDTGIGIAKEHLAKVFEPFWQVRQTERSAGGGTGLGLSVVRHLAGMLGGTVSVKSKVGVGSTFTVSFGA